ncbi:hypothetical protein QOZ96_001072 [Brevundimonas nasdae]|jgi:hypothetical protein|nr:hypothetical protein [Brevundimonas nasdae]
MTEAERYLSGLFIFVHLAGEIGWVGVMGRDG